MQDMLIICTCERAGHLDMFVLMDVQDMSWSLCNCITCHAGHVALVCSHISPLSTSQHYISNIQGAYSCSPLGISDNLICSIPGCLNTEKSCHFPFLNCGPSFLPLSAAWPRLAQAGWSAWFCLWLAQHAVEDRKEQAALPLYVTPAQSWGQGQGQGVLVIGRSSSQSLSVYRASVWPSLSWYRQV